MLQPPVLDARLAAAAAYVRPGCVAADVGCDHGRLSVALAAQGKCRKIIASDIRPAPLATAQRLVTLHGCGDVVECRLGAGLSVLRPGEADDIVIAGVSGVTRHALHLHPGYKAPFFAPLAGTARLCAAG